MGLVVTHGGDDERAGSVSILLDLTNPETLDLILMGADGDTLARSWSTRTSGSSEESGVRGDGEFLCNAEVD
jgi:hypothetical protein